MLGFVLTVTEDGHEDAVRVGVVLVGCLLQHAVHFLEREVVEHPDLKVQTTESGPEVVAVRVGPVALLQAQPGVEVHVVDHEGQAWERRGQNATLFSVWPEKSA